MSAVVEVEGLIKRYGRRVVVDRLSFEVERGEIFGMVGPNGAGKTTTIECVEGLKRPDAGRVRTLGLDPSASTRELHERIGIQLQETALPLRLEVGEAVRLFASFYRRTIDTGPLLERLGLGDRLASAYGTLSGGERQRLFIALALINDPDVVFLDELTTGLDPHARRSMWELVESIRDRGKTVFLTTHFMEEAERLCDRVAIVDRGELVGLDTPAALIRSIDRAGRRVLSIVGEVDLRAIRSLPGVRGAELAAGELVVEGDGQGLTGDLVQTLTAAGVEIRDMTRRRGTLEEVFLDLTGREAMPEETA